MHVFKKMLKSIWGRLSPQVCSECREKLGKRYGLPIRKALRRMQKRNGKRNGRKLSPGVHMVRIKGQGMRKVKVLQNGRWRFQKK